MYVFLRYPVYAMYILYQSAANRFQDIKRNCWNYVGDVSWQILKFQSGMPSVEQRPRNIYAWRRNSKGFNNNISAVTLDMKTLLILLVKIIYWDSKHGHFFLYKKLECLLLTPPLNVIGQFLRRACCLLSQRHKRRFMKNDLYWGIGQHVPDCCILTMRIKQMYCLNLLQWNYFF